jgi:hypothetical protein
VNSVHHESIMFYSTCPCPFAQFQTRLEKLERDKRSSLLVQNIIDEEKKSFLTLNLARYIPKPMPQELGHLKTYSKIQNLYFQNYKNEFIHHLHILTLHTSISDLHLMYFYQLFTEVFGCKISRKAVKISKKIF